MEGEELHYFLLVASNETLNRVSRNTLLSERLSRGCYRTNIFP